MSKLLIVCMGNICRSPMAQVVTRKLAADFPLSSPLEIDSAGTHAARVAEQIDPRARAALLRHRYQAGSLRSRAVGLKDFQNFDWILAMDRRNLADLQRLCPPEHQYKLRLFLSFSRELSESSVPDPYYGNAQGFDNVVRLCEAGARGWLRHLTDTNSSQ